jgi:outer membrane protein assembly factor BamA
LNEDESRQNYKNIKLKQIILKRIADDIYFGPQLQFSHMYNVHFNDLKAQTIAPPEVTASEGSTNVGLGMIFNWDKRDNILTPTRNHYIELSTLLYSPLLQSEYGFQSYKIDARKYFSFRESGKEILAFQALMVFTSGDVPFEEMGMVGGEIIMRGYLEGRFRDKNCIQAQMEYRRLVSGRFAAVAFGAFGNVMPGLRDLKADNTKWALGAGLRYNINKADPTYIRLDYGFGKETSGLYITFGEAF